MRSAAIRRLPSWTPQSQTAPYLPPGTITGSDRPRYLPTGRTSSPSNGSLPWGRAGTTTRATRMSTPGASTAPTRRRPRTRKLPHAANSGCKSASQPVVRARPRLDRCMPRCPRVSVPAAPTRSCRRRTSIRSASRAPLQFGPDSVWNYEIGEKAKLFDNWLTDQQRRLLHQVERHAAGAYAALRLSVLQQCRRRPLLRTRARDQCEAVRGLDRRAQRRLDGREDHPARTPRTPAS